MKLRIQRGGSTPHRALRFTRATISVVASSTSAVPTSTWYAPVIVVEAPSDRPLPPGIRASPMMLLLPMPPPMPPLFMDMVQVLVVLAREIISESTDCTGPAKKLVFGFWLSL